MKGIKKCLNWMLDNPMKEIKAVEYNKCRYNDKKKCFEYEATFSKEWWFVDGDDFEVFDDYEWYVVRVEESEEGVFPEVEVKPIIRTVQHCDHDNNPDDFFFCPHCGKPICNRGWKEDPFQCRFCYGFIEPYREEE